MRRRSRRSHGPGLRRRAAVRLAAALIAGAAVLPAVALPATATPSSPRAAFGPSVRAGTAAAGTDRHAHVRRGPFRHDLPADGPPALYQRQPRLPAPRGWPASNSAFSATSGTGRLAGGAFYWTDFLYDDHGATAANPGGVAVTAGSPSFGTYTYPSGPAHNNGADIFRAAVALRRHVTVWRVDWTTLADSRVPIAEWTFDRDDRAATGASRWPAGAGV